MENHETKFFPLFLKQLVLAHFIMFAGWCLIDWFEVHQPDYPESIHERAWLCYLVPLPALLAAYLLGKKATPRPHFLQSLIATLIALLLTIPFIALFGVWFHFWIGGKL